MNIKVILGTLLLSSAAYGKGNWCTPASEGLEQGRVIATQKFDKYNQISSSDIQRAVDYITKNCPGLNYKIAKYGLENYFKDKKDKWSRRSKLTGLDLIDEAVASRTTKGSYKFEPRNNKEWETFLTKAQQRFYTFFFQHQAKIDLEMTLKVACQKLAPPATSTQLLSLNEIQEQGEAIVNITKILKLMNLDGEIERFKSAHVHLKKKIFSLIGIREEHLTEKLSTSPLIVAIDSHFAEKSKDITKVAQTNQFSTLKDPPHKNGTLWAHGNLMATTAQNICPQAQIHRMTSSGTASGYELIEKEWALHYADKTKIKSPIIVNTSIVPYSITGMISYSEETGSHKLDKNSFGAKHDPQNFTKIEEELRKAFLSYQDGVPLTEDQLSFLKTKEQTTTISELAVKAFKTLVTGPQNDQTHVTVTPPLNDNGPLFKKGFHNGHIVLYTNQDTEDHGLVALNYNFATESLEQGSHSAREYKHIALVVPAAIVSWILSDDPLPCFVFGGHCVATAMTSSVAAHVRARFPQLTHTQVRGAILRGCDRTFKGYNEDLHGQGMLNLDGALKAAKEILL